MRSRSALFVVFLFYCNTFVYSNLRKTFDYYDIWMIREEYIPFAKKGAYERVLELDYAKKAQASRCWPCYVVEGLDAPKFIFLYPMKNYASLDSYFQQEERSQQARETAFINYTINTLFRRLTSGAYLPDESYHNWQKTPYLHYWVLSLRYDGVDDFEKHLKELAEVLKEEKSPICFRSWRVAFGADLPKFVVVLFSKTREELKEGSQALDVITSQSRQVIRSFYEGKGRLRFDFNP